MASCIDTRARLYAPVVVERLSIKMEVKIIPKRI